MPAVAATRQRGSKLKVLRPIGERAALWAEFTRTGIAAAIYERQGYAIRVAFEAWLRKREP